MTDSHSVPSAEGTGEQPLVSGPLGIELLSFHQEPEDARFDDAEVGFALVLLWRGDRVLMVYVDHRACWELPGGGIEPGERPRAAAVRELWEETGQRVPEAELRFVGFAKTYLGRLRRVLYGAVFTAVSPETAAGPGAGPEPAPFVPNSEVSAVHWRRDREPMPDGGRVQTVDEYLVARFQP
ncbi:NUDIX hydrolase [Streptomyces armeniacus]|uniref:NUDIX hydrolase n=1 Tax=Streptomyces armeniacus TaxID=83291 RepID=A0A345XNQ8_9ACTN|nr:NUDIX hydrolase [Streptomyces armeniacus]AXK33274.1 NUDIX hydrolase [Streptomyces armeniacus]